MFGKLAICRSIKPVPGRLLLFLVGSLLAGVILQGCAITDPPIRTEEPVDTKTWEKAWVDPQIVIADSLFTLIRSERIDSFVVDRTGYWAPELKSSVEFSIDRDSCFVNAIMKSSMHDLVVLPLLARTLGRGYYKLTPGPGILNRAEGAVGSYEIEVTACGKAAVASVGR